MESGNFETAFHAEKNKPNSRKKLNFDTLKCGNCSGYVMVLWSASEHGFDNGLHDYKRPAMALEDQPASRSLAPERWPVLVAGQAQSCRRELGRAGNHGAISPAGHLRDQGASGDNLKKEIDGLTEKGVVPPVMSDWSHQVRQLGQQVRTSRSESGTTERPGRVGPGELPRLLP